MKELKFDTSNYILVKEISTNLLLATLKVDTPGGEWKNLLDEEIWCIPINEAGELEPIRGRNVIRRELDTDVWIRIK